MNRRIAIFFAVLAAGMGAGIISYHLFRQAASPIVWLKSEFSLNEHQTAQVAALQSEYAKACEEMCARIGETDARVSDLVRSQTIVTSEIREALSASDRLRTECRLKMLEHCYKVATAMPEEKRGKYIEMILPVILDPGRMADEH
ncbi:MAG TPA: hypothetical protein VIT23_09240 [Terrimicrobiaceae bacterium]